MVGSRTAGSVDTRSAILDVAERLVQRQGFNGFSYADVASELGITKAALHYHFPGKAELGESLIRRYAARFCETLKSIDARDGAAPDKLLAYIDIYRAVLRDDRMCLCGMLAAEYQTLPAPMRLAVVGFFDDNESWLAGLLEAGRGAGTITFGDPSRQAAQMIIAGLEGAMLVSRPYAGTVRFDEIANRLAFEFMSTCASPARSSKSRATAASHATASGRR
jgi:TetR/AcrR family transcriptional regulator, transcriptional repressor for nem operon